eukprot:3723355-Rhodomonas_salina.5
MSGTDLAYVLGIRGGLPLTFGVLSSSLVSRPGISLRAPMPCPVPTYSVSIRRLPATLCPASTAYLRAC